MKQRCRHACLLVVLWVMAGGFGCGESGKEDTRTEVEAAIPPKLLASREPQQTAELVDAGREAFRAHRCTDCHSVDGSASVGPPLQGIYDQQVRFADGRVVRRDLEYLYRAIAAPRAQTVDGYHPDLMPAYDYGEPEALVALAEYVKALTPAPPAAAQKAWSADGEGLD